MVRMAKAFARLRDPRNYYFYMQRRVLNAQVRSSLASLEARLFPRTPQTSNDPLAKQLLERGYTDAFRLLSDDQVREFREQLSAVPLYDPNHAHPDFSLENVPADTHIAHIRERDIVRVPGVMEVANNKRVIDVISSVFACKPTLDCVIAWWSMPGHDRPEEAQFFHRDVDSLSFLKLFIYLTDVDEDAGPHVYVALSHKKNMPGEKIRRYTDEEIESFYGKDKIIRFTGPAGTCFLENTFGYHKGALPKDKRRLILQFIYAVHPTPYGPRSPYLKLSELPAGADPFVNRLFAA